MPQCVGAPRLLRVRDSRTIALVDNPADHPSLRETQAATPVTLHSEPGQSRSRATDVNRGGELEVLGRIGRFVPIECIGRGGMGVVWAAYDPELDRKVAIKLIAAAATQDTVGDRATDRMLREARALAKLTDANVVAVYDVGTHGNAFYIAMEFVDGEPLDRWLVPPRTWQQRLDVFVPAGRGLAAAHAAGLVHRDFKPSNVVVARGGRVVVLDFGLARAPVAETFAAAEATGLDPRATEGGALLGTPAYMSPEQWRGLAVDARSDQFNYCVALWEALCAAHPFDRSSTLTLAQSVTTGAVREPPAGAAVPARILAVVRRGLASEPAARWPSMPALLDELTRARTRSTPLLAIAGMAVVGALGWTALAQPVALDNACAAASERIGTVWTHPRRDQLAKAFAAPGKTFATDAWTRVEPALDTYARAWSAAVTDACVTARDGTTTSEQAALQTACHGDALHRFDALVERLADADVESIVRATDAAAGLPALDRCADLVRLRAATPDGADPAAEAEVRAQLAKLTAALDVGDHATVAALAPTLQALTEQTSDAGLRAELLRARANVAALEGPSTVATADLEAAANLALSAGRDELFVAIGSEVAVALVLSGGSREAAEAWWKIASATLEHTGVGGALEIETLRTGSLIALTRHEIGRSRELAQLAAQHSRERFGEAHFLSLRTGADLARVTMLAGDVETALAAYPALIAAARETYGPRHPATLELLDFELVAQIDAGRREGLVDRARALLEIHDSEGDPPFWALLNLARAQATEGQWAPADATLAEAHAQILATFGVDYRASGITAERARIAFAAGRPGPAWEFAQQCERELRSSDEGHEAGALAVAGALVDVVQLAVSTEHFAEADRLLAEILAAFEQHDSEDESEALVLLVAAELAIARGHFAEADQHAAAAITWLEALDRKSSRTYVEALAAAADTARLSGNLERGAERAQQALEAAQAQSSTHPNALRRAWLAVAASASDRGDRDRCTAALDQVRTLAGSAPIDPELELRATVETARADPAAVARLQVIREESRTRSPWVRAIVDAASREAARR